MYEEGQDETKPGKAERRVAELDGLATLKYHSRITQFLRGATRHGAGDITTIVDFRPLYAAAIYDLQRQLSREIAVMIKCDVTDRQLGRMQRMLRRYS